jgi:hypothetical protein
MRGWRAGASAALVGVLGLSTLLAAVGAQGPPPAPSSEPKVAAPIERLGKDQLRVGTIMVNTARREISVAGVANKVNIVEFIACTKGGFKAYESALELDTNAVNFNLALILIGLDKAHARLPARHFDPIPPAGDPVEIWVEWDAEGKKQRVRAEALVYNTKTKVTLAEGPWVYTGSTFMQATNGYMADVDGTLIGFVHTSSPVIESPRSVDPDSYPLHRLNPALGLQPGTAVVVTVHALDAAK